MKTLDETIEYTQMIVNMIPNDGADRYDAWTSILHYLKAYRDQQMIFSGHQPISYWGGKTRPIIQVDGEYYCVIDYTHKHNGCWRCIKVKPIGDGIFDGWTCCDDDNFLMDREGKMIYREIGWNLREEKI